MSSKEPERGPELSPVRSGRDPFAFHPIRAAISTCIGLFAGLILCAATAHWAWLLLAPAGGLLLAFDFWKELLPEMDEFPSDHS